MARVFLERAIADESCFIDCSGRTIRPRDLVIVIVDVQPPANHELVDVVFAHDALGFRFCFGKRGQKHPGENRDDGDDDEKFDQREGTAVHAARLRHSHKVTVWVMGACARRLLNSINSGNAWQ